MSEAKLLYRSAFIILTLLREILPITSDTTSFINFSDALCGKYSEKRGRIVGGNKITPGEFPWVVSVRHKGSHTCGGVVVNKKWVITAAHCFCSGSSSFYPKDKYSVAINRNGSREISFQNMSISKLQLHPEYKCNRLENDVALLKVDNDISWLNADPACFPVGGESIFSNLSDTDGIAVGWGATNEDLSKGKIPAILHKVQLPILENQVCQKWYRSQNKTLSLQKSQMCAGYKNGKRDACWADSGGPLMVKNGMNMVVVGIVSTGIGCARASLPGIYTRLTEYVNWIALIINQSTI